MKCLDNSRRKFITQYVPACALLCAGSKRLWASVTYIETDPIQDSKHPFDRAMERTYTYRQFFAAQYREVIEMGLAIEKEMGKEKAIDFLKKATAQRLFDIGKMQASRMPQANFDMFVNQFRQGYGNTLSREIAEDSEKAFELKVTECLWADTFLRAKAGEIGYAWICWGDYAWAEGFNPKFKLIRDKTLMQGNECCNHRYIWQE